MGVQREANVSKFTGALAIHMIGIPWPWPPQEDVSHVVDPINGSRRTFTVDKQGRIIGTLEDQEGVVIARAVSPPLIFSEKTRIIIAIRWHGDGTADFWINDKRLSAGDQQPVFIESRAFDATVHVDIEGIRAAERKRKDIRRGLKGSTSVTNVLRRRIEDLEQQLDEIEGLLTLHSAGRAMDSSLATKLRILVGSDSGDGLIRHVAALADRPLPVFAAGGASRSLNFKPEFALTGWTMSTSSINATVQTDLDAWLEWEVLIFEGETLTHSALIKALADQRGAHIDRAPKNRVLLMLNSKLEAQAMFQKYVTTGAAELSELSINLIGEARLRL